jgi:hypothetical protein
MRELGDFFNENLCYEINFTALQFECKVYYEFNVLEQSSSIEKLT